MKIWKQKTEEIEECGASMYAHDDEDKWYVNNGCSKHMTGDKDNLLYMSKIKIGNMEIWPLKNIVR